MQAVKCYQKYSLSEKHNYKIQTEIYIAQTLPYQVTTRCSTRKIIRLVNNLLKFNNFQCAMLCWLLKKTNFIDSINKISSNDISQIKIVQEDYEKKVFLFLLLNGYHVKNNFFSQGAQIDIDPLLFQNVKNFHQVFKAWKPQKSVKNASLVDINKIFQNWNHTRNTKSKVDYNKVVDKILYLSKTYNVGGAEDLMSVKQQPQKLQKKEMKNRKKKEKESIVQRKSKYEYKQAEKQVIYNSPMKNSASQKVPWFQDDRNINVDLGALRRSTRTLNRSNLFQIKDDRYDLNPNQSLFRSFRSRQSDNMFNSIRNTNNGGAFLNLSTFNNNNSLGFGNMFRTTKQSDINLTQNQKNKHNKKEDLPQRPKLKPTVSFEQLK